MITLRPYQEKFIGEVARAVFKDKRIISCMATGGGKTKVFIEISKRAIAKGKVVLIVSESVKIYKQIANEVSEAECIADGVKEEKINLNAKLFVAMGQTLVRRENVVSWFNSLSEKLLVIVDEAHVGTNANLIRKLMSALHLGFTATPSFKQAKHLPELYNDIVIGAQPQELVEMGFLSPYRHFMRKVVDLSGLKLSGGEYTEKSQELAFEKPEVYEGLIDDLKEFDYKKAMIFCASIKHCEELSAVLRSNGYELSVVHSKNKNSDYELYQFMQGDIKLCVSVGVLTKGFDFPAIDHIFIQRAIASLPLYLQICGRGSRTFPGKENFTVVDYGGNGKRHNLWNYERDWKKLWNGKDKKEGVAPVKDCPECFFIMPINVSKCPNCGHLFEKEENKEEIKKQTELIELTATYNLIRGKKIADLSPRELSIYVKQTNKKAFGKRIAMAKGWEYLIQYAKEIGWKKGWNYFIQPNLELEFSNITIK